MILAKQQEINEIYEFYKDVVSFMNEKGPQIGWNIQKYPDYSFVEEMVNRKDMFLEREDGKIICAAAINHEMNPEYDDISWEISGPKEQIVTIHALAVAPDCRGQHVSDQFLLDIEEYCRSQGYLAIHFDVIEGNEPAMKLYARNHYQVISVIPMYYEVVGTKEFHMMEKVL